MELIELIMYNKLCAKIVLSHFSKEKTLTVTVEACQFMYEIPIFLIPKENTEWRSVLSYLDVIKYTENTQKDNRFDDVVIVGMNLCNE